MKKIFLLISLPIVVVLMLLSFSPNKNKKDSISSKTDSFVLVQLFTSQGCSSCPPADKLLDEVKKQYSNKNVYVLSYHVDYWNRLGWKDPFSKREYTDLQYKYGSKFNTRSVYTPQAIVNGQSYFVGSNESKMKENIAKFLKDSNENSIKIEDVLLVKNKINFQYSIEGNVSEKKLKIALVIDRRETDVGRGENSGKKLLNSNIVVEEKSINLDSKFGNEDIIIPETVKKTDVLHLIAFLQDENYVISAATEVESL